LKPIAQHATPSLVDFPSSAMADKRNVDCVRLKHLVKEKNILWDVTATADEYKLSELKPLAWKEIADVLESDTSLFLFCVLVSA